MKARAAQPQHSAEQAAQELEVDGFEQVLVEARLARGVAVVFAPRARHGDDAGAGELRVGAQLARDREAVDAGQAQVEEHEIRPHAPRELGGGEAVARLMHLVPGMLQPRRDHRHRIRVVVDQQNLARCARQAFSPLKKRRAVYCRATLSSSSTPRLIKLVTRCASEASICFASVRSQIRTTAPTILPSSPRKGEAETSTVLTLPSRHWISSGLLCEVSPARARPSGPPGSLIIWPAESHQPSISP